MLYFERDVFAVKDFGSESEMKAFLRLDATKRARRIAFSKKDMLSKVGGSDIEQKITRCK